MVLENDSRIEGDTQLTNATLIITAVGDDCIAPQYAFNDYGTGEMEIKFRLLDPNERCSTSSDIHPDSILDRGDRSSTFPKSLYGILQPDSGGEKDTRSYYFEGEFVAHHDGILESLGDRWRKEACKVSLPINAWKIYIDVNLIEPEDWAKQSLESEPLRENLEYLSFRVFYNSNNGTVYHNGYLIPTLLQVRQNESRTCFNWNTHKDRDIISKLLSEIGDNPIAPSRGSWIEIQGQVDSNVSLW
ncbi:uncharacterized protein I206_101016 [Kwoniella pini CBS 10737]|uniref:Uncharacterized protein n=1 Tax=Kwoniella pini CBS 10737 TaxID=1296096 RepID=A0A1B9IBP0_9TREE|nr:uncharacterized protein I206_00310 [Kwoniella pini CBS 10737]OCF53009.1 hypothetical protein I206_00310 [Kwoniella pini CBS 10737]